MNLSYSYTAGSSPAMYPVHPFINMSDKHVKVTSLDLFIEYEQRVMRSSSFEILWVCEGEGSIQMNGVRHTIEAGTVICIAPGQHRLISDDGTLQGYYLRISPELMHNLERDGTSPLFANQLSRHAPLIFRIDESMRLAEEILQRMQNLLTDLSYNATEILNGYLKIFLLYIGRNNRVVQTNGFGRDAEMVDQFLSLIRQHFTDKKMVADYASELFVTAAYLNRIVKKVTGHTASHHIQQYIILEAKRIGGNSRKSMKEIAYGLGFNDIAHFSKFFKNYTGMNFTSFKRDCSLPRNPCEKIY